ncbi:MAG: PAS domain-containing protein [Verrucomicrobiota bacterium]|jgi:PAS domain-containing protein
MRQLAVQFLDQGFHRVLFDAMPMPVFVVDNDVRIFDYNAAAAELLGKDKKLVLRRRGGDVLNCVHSMEGPKGCGSTPACRDCVVRNSVRGAARGRGVTRQWAQMELVRKGKVAKVKLRVSCQPFTYGRSSFVLLVLEGLND